MYQSPGDTLTTIPGILKITECLESCQNNVTCRSINYETGLCILFSSSASSNPSGLQPSQFPVFTIYAQKICLSKKSLSRSSCDQRSWAFEKVPAYELRRFPSKKLSQVTQPQCMEACLSETEFICRSFNYDSASQECILSEQDRHTLAVNSNARSKDSQSLLPSANGTTDYYESNCVVGEYNNFDLFSIWFIAMFLPLIHIRFFDIDKNYVYYCLCSFQLAHNPIISPKIQSVSLPPIDHHPLFRPYLLVVH